MFGKSTKSKETELHNIYNCLHNSIEKEKIERRNKLLDLISIPIRAPEPL